MLEIKNLEKAYEHPVISDFSCKFSSSGLYVIRGASGSGKTTLLHLISGLVKADKGGILWMKEPVFSFVFQDARLIPTLTLLENILLVKKKRDPKKALEVLKRLGLSEDAKKYPSSLSGGMKLRGALARSLYYGGNVFLWDEPTKELDAKNREEVIKILNEISKDALVIVSTHDTEIESPNEITL